VHEKCRVAPPELVAQVTASAENPERDDTVHAWKIRELVERRLPPNSASAILGSTSRYQLQHAARGGEINDAVIALRLVLHLEQVPCPQSGVHYAA
jgi:hypothetical protein